MTKADKFRVIVDKIRLINDDIEATRERLHIQKNKKAEYINELQRLVNSLPNGQLKTNIQARITSAQAEQSDLTLRLW